MLARGRPLSGIKPFYGWWVLGALLISSMFGAAIVWFGFTAYFGPLAAEFGWSYTAISVVAGMRGVETGLADLFAGFLVDRFGGRRVILAGALLMSAGFLLLSRTSSLATFYAYYFVVSVGVTGSSLVVGMTILSRWFRRRLGTVLGIASAGGGISGFLVPLIVYLVDTFGFRTAFVIFGLSALVVGVCVALLVRDRPEPLGYGPDGDVLGYGKSAPAHIGPTEIGGEPSRDVSGARFTDVLHSRIFWTLVLVSLGQVFVSQMLITHIMPYLESIGYSRHVAGQAAMAIPVFSVFGRLGFGWLGDRFNRRNMLIIGMSLQTVGVIILAYAGASSLIIPFLVFYGVGWGAMVPNRAAILRDYFGVKHFGSMLGAVVGLSLIGGLFGPVLAGKLYDTTGSYYMAFTIAAWLLVLGTVLLFSLRQPTTPAKG